MSRPRIDVLLPVRCARRTLPSALGDVLAQQDVAVRVIAVVDDGPEGDDGSLGWLEARARDDRRLLVVKGPGRGAGAALDLGLERATAPLLSHMEADDRCPPDRFARLAAALEADGSLSAMTSRAAQFGARTPGMRRYLDWQNGLLTHEEMASQRFVEIPALHQTGLYRTEAVRTVGGYEPSGAWPPDIDFWMRWFERDLPVIKLPRVLYRWRQHAGQSTRGGGRHALSALRACKVAALSRLHGTRGLEPRPLLLVSTGATLVAWRDALSASDITLAGAVDWKPGRPAPRIRDDAIVLAVYGSTRVRARLAASLGAEQPIIEAA
jgi:glycosyltransferase involved in cell wall biosynthesis